MAVEPCIDQEVCRARVEAAPWCFFHIPVVFRTKDLALIAWRHVSYVLARQTVGFVPEVYFGKGDWEQFVELLCGGSLTVYLLVVENRQSWHEVVQAIDAHISTASISHVAVALPYFDWQV